jgi:hypothetical protein
MCRTPASFLGAFVVRRFNLADILLVRRLQDQVACLDLQAALLWSPPPLSLALLELFSFNQSPSTTFVENDHSADGAAQGFLQAWTRPDGLSCDVEFVAPALDGSAVSAELWRSLLEHLIAAKGKAGIQRIFATVPDGGLAADLLRKMGFSAYARRYVMRLGQLPAGLDAEGNAPFRPARDADAQILRRLRTSLIPRPVQHAEGGTHAEKDPASLLPWWKSREIEEYVWNEGADIQAYVRIVVGQHGHWLRVLLEPAAAVHADSVLSESLSLLSSHPARPVYCAVREYEGGVQGALDALGFEPLASEVLMVKQIAVRARVPVNNLSPALEKSVETATPISTSNHCQDQP